MSSLFGKSCHTGFVVPNLDAAVARMLESGIGPAFMLRRLLTLGRYRGKSNSMTTNVAFINAGGVQYEILEQLDNSDSIYHEFLQKHPEGGLHHMAYYSADFAADLERARTIGLQLSIVQEFMTPDGTTFEIYMEPVKASDPLIVQFMYPGPAESVFREMETISANWDRKDPIRNMFDLLPSEIAAALPTARD